MAAPLPKWSDTALRVALVAVCAGAAGLTAAPMLYMRTVYGQGRDFEVDQPLQFDHRHHVVDDGIDCRVCHTRVEVSARAGMPSTDVCAGCHNQVWPDSPMLEPLRRSLVSGRPIPWSRVHQLPDHVYFNHAVHVRKGVGCVSCHGRVDEMALVRQVKPLTMGWCIGCHRAPEGELRPVEHMTDMRWQQSEGEGARLAAQYGTRHLTHCSTCHR